MQEVTKKKDYDEKSKGVTADSLQTGQTQTRTRRSRTTKLSQAGKQTVKESRQRKRRNS